MACTTILVGKKASYDGSTMIARNDDSGSGHFTAKKFVVVQPEEHPAVYRSVLSHVEIPLPGNALRMTAMPNAVEGKGIWAASGVNAANVGMTATETITSNPRVLGADPLVVYQPAQDGQPEVPGGIGEEDIVYLVLPYIHSAREGVLRLGRLLEEYGTYEMNGIAFQDVDEIWWLETIGGHHWMARRVPDDAYVVMPNQLGIDAFDLEDAFGAQENYLCSSDLREFIRDNHLDLSLDGCLNPRDAFGSHDDADHVYNTPPRMVHASPPQPEYMGLGRPCCRLRPPVGRPALVHGAGAEADPGGREVCTVLPLSGHSLRPLRQLWRQEHEGRLPLHRHQPQRLHGPHPDAA